MEDYLSEISVILAQLVGQYLPLAQKAVILNPTHRDVELTVSADTPAQFWKNHCHSTILQMVPFTTELASICSGGH